MKVHLIKKQSIEDYCRNNAGSRSSFVNLLAVLKFADWNEPAHVLKTFKSADFLGNGSDRIVFNIGGNNFRMICKFYFGDNNVHLFVKWIGTHAEYSKLCSEGKQYEIDVF